MLHGECAVILSDDRSLAHVATSVRTELQMQEQQHQNDLQRHDLHQNLGFADGW